MDVILKANIFFFVTTVCVVAVSVFVIIFFIRLSNLTKTLSKLMEDLMEKAGSLGKDAGRMLADIRESFVYRLFFGRKKKPTKTKKK